MEGELSQNATFAKTNLAFGKIVATPTPSAWSQAYNAGTLFAVVSLTALETPDDLLPTLGKEVLETLEQEYFTLEVKDLEHIKGAITNTEKKIPKEKKHSLAVAVIIPQTASGRPILYVFTKDGKALLRRLGKLATIVEGEETLESASGFLEDGDTIVLATREFTSIIPVEVLSSSLATASPSEIAENLAPTVHKANQGGATAIVVYYTAQILREEQEPPLPKSVLGQFFPKAAGFLSALPKRLRKAVDHPKRVVISVAIILLFVLLSSIFFALTKQQEVKQKTLFQETFGQAQQKYEEGQGLLLLNQNAAKDSLSQAKQKLTKLKAALSKDAKEQQRVLALLAKVEATLTIASGISVVGAQEVDPKESLLLAHELKTQNYTLFTQDQSTIYATNEREIASLKKKTNKTTTIIRNENLWLEAAGLGTYNTNLYLLDRKTGKIIKFVAQSPPAGGGYSNVNYLASGVTQDFSKAVSLAVDTSVWVLLSDGVILKFTRGKNDAFTLKGLDTPLKNPTKIFTNTEVDNLYILDNGNSRVVVFDKAGSYVKQYQAGVIGKASDFDVAEKQKKLFLLAEGKVFAIAIE